MFGRVCIDTLDMWVYVCAGAVWGRYNDERYCQSFF